MDSSHEEQISCDLGGMLVVVLMLLLSQRWDDERDQHP